MQLDSFTVSKDGWATPTNWTIPREQSGKLITITYRIEACRTGWLGAWDAIVSAVRGRAILTVPREIEVKFTMSGKEQVGVMIDQVSIKESK